MCFSYSLYFFFFFDLGYFFSGFNKNSNLYFFYWESDYYWLVFYLLGCFLLTLILFFISFFIFTKSNSFEKGSPYECGFEPFNGDTFCMFNIQFFLVGILFMLFDLEVVYLIAWVLHLSSISIIGFWVGLLFLVLLTVGFVYEWKKGALDWV